MYVYFPCLHEAHSVLSTYLMGQRHEKGFWPTQTTHINKPSIMRFHGQVCCANVCGCVCVCTEHCAKSHGLWSGEEAKRRRARIRSKWLFGWNERAVFYAAATTTTIRRPAVKRFIFPTFSGWIDCVFFIRRAWTNRNDLQFTLLVIHVVFCHNFTNKRNNKYVQANYV